MTIRHNKHVVLFVYESEDTPEQVAREIEKRLNRYSRQRIGVIDGKPDIAVAAVFHVEGSTLSNKRLMKARQWQVWSAIGRVLRMMGMRDL